MFSHIFHWLCTFDLASLILLKKVSFANTYIETSRTMTKAKIPSLELAQHVLMVSHNGDTLPDSTWQQISYFKWNRPQTLAEIYIYNDHFSDVIFLNSVFLVIVSLPLCLELTQMTSEATECYQSDQKLPWFSGQRLWHAPKEVLLTL